MMFIPAFIFTVLPTLLILSFINKIKFIKSIVLQIGFSWFIGQYLFVWLVFLMSIILSIYTQGILVKALLLVFSIIIIFSLIRLSSLVNTLQDISKAIKEQNIKNILTSGFIFSAIFLFSYLFYIYQLSELNGKIFTSVAYWDFQWHMPLIQNFVYGDNFPPQNESFAGLPSTYHFFWGLFVSIYATSGLKIVGAINYISIITMFFLLISVIAFMEELFSTKIPGLIAGSLIVTSSSFRFINEVSLVWLNGLSDVIGTVFNNTNNPFFYSFIPGNPFGYNGTMFNLFYFLAERQMVPGLIYLLIIIMVFYKIHHFRNKSLVLIGLLAGLYFLWHLYITIMVFCACLVLIIFLKNRKKTLYFFSGFIVTFTCHYLYFKNLQGSEWFLKDIASYPKLNFNFSTMNEVYSLSLVNFLGYYFFGYGIKILFFILGTISVWKKNKSLILIFLAFIIPAFILTNSIQLSPLSIYDNHKWLRPMNLLVDIAAGYGFYHLFFIEKVNKKLRLLIVPSLIALTLSGIIEIIPFFQARPTDFFANEHSILVRDIRNHTNPKSVFIGNDTKEIHLAGRKLFLGNYSGQDLRLDSSRRQKIIHTIYSLETKEELCKLTNIYDIDYIETDLDKFNKLDMPGKKSVNQKNEMVNIIDINKGCL